MNGKTSVDKPAQNGKNSKHRGRLLGPVPDLEEHVRPDWWQSIFDSLYLKTDGDVVDNDNITRQEVDLLLQIFKLVPQGKILDLCCGQGRHCLELAKRGFEYIEGLDRSHYLVQKARLSAKKEGLNIRFREGDARKLPYSPDTFDVIMIVGNSFGYFETIQDDLRVLKEIFRILKPWGRLELLLPTEHLLNYSKTGGLS